MSTRTRSIRTTFLAVALLGAAACSAEIGAGADYDYTPDAGFVPEPVDTEVCDEAVAITFEQRQVTPDIMLVLDKSGSMGQALVDGSNTSKWDVMRTATASIVSNNGDKVNFGLMMFPWTSNCNNGQVRVAPALNNVGGILAEMNSIGPGGRTPTHQSLEQARAYFNSNPVNADGRIVILATDGLPVCSTIGESVTAIQSLQQLDIKTYVLGFGFGNADVSGLQQMASAGGTGQIYSADSPNELNLALDSILGDVTVPSCEFELQETPANADDINVTINGVELVRNDPNGWSYDEPTNTISLDGASCESVQSGGTSGIEVDLGCEGTIVD
ncbi:MAG: VWA domain-containing protein [Myxococcales bacterium]|nr:VWA domain-containing protein [Myxococcales bacterium]